MGQNICMYGTKLMYVWDKTYVCMGQSIFPCIILPNKSTQTNVYLWVRRVTKYLPIHRSTLLSHEIIHTGERRFVCQIRDKKCTHKLNRCRHKLSVIHRVEHQFNNCHIILWQTIYSWGAMPQIIRHVISIYPFINPTFTWACPHKKTSICMSNMW